MSTKRKLCEEDNNSFEDPWIEFQRINLCILEGKMSFEQDTEDLESSPSPPRSEPLRERPQEQRCRFPFPAARKNGGSMHISDFGPSYPYYGVVQSCARMAIAKYNDRLETSPYKFVKINKVARTLVNGVDYKITFQAERPGKLATFKARVSVTRHGTKVVRVWKTAQQDLAMVMGHQTDINTEGPAKKKIKRPQCTRMVEITDEALVLKQRISRRGAIIRRKQKELSPQDAAVMIQRNFRAYKIRRSHSLRAIRELANAKTKFKELRELFNNFTYRRRVALDVEERQRFSEKIIALLDTVNAVERVDLLVKSAWKSMVNKLETMITDVDRGSATR